MTSAPAVSGLELTASAWVARHVPPVASGATRTALDVASGGGRHARLAQMMGYAVTALDRDVSAVLSIPGLDAIQANLEDGSPWPLGTRTFHAVIVTNYLYRPALPAIVAAVAPDGILIYETFALGQARYGRPSNPDFLLMPGELLSAVHGRLTPFAYEHATLLNPERIVQRIAAVGPAHRWLETAPVQG